MRHVNTPSSARSSDVNGRAGVPIADLGLVPTLIIAVGRAYNAHPKQRQLAHNPW